MLYGSRKKKNLSKSKDMFLRHFFLSYSKSYLFPHDTKRQLYLTGPAQRAAVYDEFIIKSTF